MKNLLHFFRRKWCILDLSYVGGGYIGQTYTVKYPDDVFDQFQIAAIELPHFTKAGYITSRAIIDKFYFKKKAEIKIYNLIYGSLFDKLAYGFLALCRIDKDSNKKTVITIVEIENRKTGNHPYPCFYTVVDSYNSISSPKAPPHNVWTNIQNAEHYKDILQSKIEKPITHHLLEQYVVKPYY